MDSRYLVTREEFHDVQMDLKRYHSIQQQHSERLRLLEKRQADDAALKSVWNSPFPSVLGGTPQHGPLHMPANELFSELEEQGHSLLNSLHLEAEDEPARKGAASRANSVRFDESALHGSNWAQGGRHSSDFATIRPGTEMGGHQMMERSLSHKSDGRHSSAGYSVHSAHSGISGRASSLGLDTNFMIGGRDDDSPVDVPEPPPGFYVLGSAPSIIRCWLTTNFTSSSLLYAVVCTGSQKTTVEYSLLKDLDLVNNIHREVDGVYRITLPVFLAEARVTQSNSRSTSPAPQLPSITASFEVTGMGQEEGSEARKSIRVVIGSHTLRLHSADILLSQNSMTLYGNDRDKLSVPFVRPEDDAVFKYLTTANMVPGRQKLNASAPEFVAGEKSGNTPVPDSGESVFSKPKTRENGSEGVLSPGSHPSQPMQEAMNTNTATSESGAESDKQTPAPIKPETGTGKESSGSSESTHREPTAALMRTPWRQTAIGAVLENGPLSGYQPATRPRNMKVLRPNKSAASSTSARTGAAYEPAPVPRSSSEYRRKSQPDSSNSHPPSSSSSSSWGNSNKRSVSSAAISNHTIGNFGGGGGEGKLQQSSVSHHQENIKTPASATSSPAVPRTANNPLGSATAFSWIAQSNKSTPSATAAE